MIQENLKVFASTITGGHFDKNKYSCADIILVKTNLGPKMCVKHCLLVNTCVAVNYIRNKYTCELLGTTSSTLALQHREGSEYTEVNRWKTVGNNFYYIENIILLPRFICIHIINTKKNYFHQILTVFRG